jgi:hypothetical protein
MFWVLNENGVFSQPDVLQLAEVANFVIANFHANIQFLAKANYEFIRILAISASGCAKIILIYICF